MEVQAYVDYEIIPNEEGIFVPARFFSYRVRRWLYIQNHAPVTTESAFLCVLVSWKVPRIYRVFQQHGAGLPSPDTQIFTPKEWTFMQTDA